jgi:hypothetical protein
MLPSRPERGLGYGLEDEKRTQSGRARLRRWYTPSSIVPAHPSREDPHAPPRNLRESRPELIALVPRESTGYKNAEVKVRKPPVHARTQLTNFSNPDRVYEIPLPSALSAVIYPLARPGLPSSPLVSKRTLKRVP